jgi:hypothetical protein
VEHVTLQAQSFALWRPFVDTTAQSPMDESADPHNSVNN